MATIKYRSADPTTRHGGKPIPPHPHTGAAHRAGTTGELSHTALPSHCDSSTASFMNSGRGSAGTGEAAATWCRLLPAARYLIVVRDDADRAPVRAHLTADELVRALPWLRHRNALGAAIEARPWSPRHVLVAGLAPASLRRLVMAHEPAAIVEAGLGQLQAWITVADHDFDPAVAAEVGQQLAVRFGGCIPAASARALGQLPGYTHPAASRRGDGSPWVLRLVSARGPLVDRHGAGLIAAARTKRAQGATMGRRPPDHLGLPLAVGRRG